MAKDWKIFKLNRLRFNELANDAWDYLYKVYGISRDSYSAASPFSIILTVCIHLGRMILFYINDALEANNLSSAYRPDVIRGLARLTGAEPSRPVSARAAARLTFKNTGNLDFAGSGTTTCFIANKQSVTSFFGIPYIILMNGDSASMTIGGDSTPSAGNYIDCHLIQGTLKVQKATSDGYPLQSFNFSERNYRQCDQHFVNVYVNGKPWKIVKSFLDMHFNSETVVVSSSAPGTRDGLTLFFGNGDYGKIPEAGATILVEYVVSDGLAGNLDKDYANSTENFWRLDGNAYLANGDTISLNENFNLTLLTSCILGSQAEDITLTQRLAPHTSRSFVLANETNYKYFLGRMNIFSTIEVLTGRSNREANTNAQIMLEKVTRDYNNAVTAYQDELSMSGENSDATLALYEKVQNQLTALKAAKERVESTSFQDNTVYLLLIPDISKRISSAVNYFTCDEALFTLSQEEQENIIEMIDNSQQAILTLEHRIIQPKVARFALNVNAKLWEGYNKADVYANAIDKISDYFINSKRRDMIPVSDITAIMEAIEGVDSVKVWFDADKENENIYGDGNYGIDEFGDILLTRNYVTAAGESKKVRDIMPLVRGGFMTVSGIEYSDVQSPEYLSAFNLNVTAYTQNTNLSMDNPVN